MTKLLAVWISSLLLALFIIVLQSGERLSSAELLIGAIIADLVVFIALIRLYSAWQYIHLRLVHRKIDYISTTNKTKLWQKSELVLARDVLIARFEIRPILKRIAVSMLVLTAIVSSNFLILSITTIY